mmetsp:Transcript_8971/g.21613  ORF Transcript_8971/g.21613 Transcript_8971/m.21613 type:complete len:233 (+) Transcript_8971:327-1025(+)
MRALPCRLRVWRGRQPRKDLLDVLDVLKGVRLEAVGARRRGLRVERLPGEGVPLAGLGHLGREALPLQAELDEVLLGVAREGAGVARPYVLRALLPVPPVERERLEELHLLLRRPRARLCPDGARVLPLPPAARRVLGIAVLRLLDSLLRRRLWCHRGWCGSLRSVQVMHRLGGLISRSAFFLWAFASSVVRIVRVISLKSILISTISRCLIFRQYCGYQRVRSFVGIHLQG